MNTICLWTKNFIALLVSNALLFAGFHILLPTLPLYAAANGATGSQIGVITGIFGVSAIFIRLFTDYGVRVFGKKKLFISWTAYIFSVYFRLYCI